MKLSLWAEAEGKIRPLSSKTSVQKLISDCQAWRISRVYAQVYRRGFAWWASNASPQAPGSPTGEDCLGQLLEACREADIELHAWVNCLNFGAEPSSETLDVLSNDSLLADSLGYSVRDYQAWSTHPSAPAFSLDTPGAWADPSAPKVRKLLPRICRELFLRYPKLHGLHLDFIRYPYFLPIRPGAGINCGIDLGYGNALQRFQADTGLDALREVTRGEWANAVLAQRFDDWRRNNITSLLQVLRQELAPQAKLSAAVLAWPDRAYLSAFQDWRSWVLEKYLDRAALMAYSADSHLVSLMALQASAFAGLGAEVEIGIGCYKFAEPTDFEKQIRKLNSIGIQELALFSYSTLASRPELCAILKKNDFTREDFSAREKAP